MKSIPEKITIISPHIDDSFLSLGGLISHASRQVSDVINVFTITNYTISGIGEVSTVTNLRKKEELAINKQYGHFSIFLDYPDAIIRIGEGEEDYIRSDYVYTNDVIYFDLKSELRSIFLERNCSYIYFPLGIGNHIDHELLFQIGMELSEEGFSISFYEEVGYEEALDGDIITLKKKILPPGFMRHILEFSNIDEKIKNLQRYESQIDPRLEDLTRKCYTKNGGEVVWRSL